MDDMDEGLIKLTNHRDHPTNIAYKVYFFHLKKQADYFRKLLKEKNIYFEEDSEMTEKGQLYLFGTRKTDNKMVIHINYLTLGEFRKSLIPNKWIKTSLLIFGFLILVFALISYYKNAH